MGGGRGREACSGLSELHRWKQNSEEVEVSIPGEQAYQKSRIEEGATVLRIMYYIGSHFMSCFSI